MLVRLKAHIEVIIGMPLHHPVRFDYLCRPCTMVEQSLDQENIHRQYGFFHMAFLFAPPKYIVWPGTRDL